VENNEDNVNSFPSMESHFIDNEEVRMQSHEKVPEMPLNPWSVSKINVVTSSRGEKSQWQTKEPRKNR